MILSNGVASVFRANAHIIQTYSPTWTRAPTWCKCVDGGGVGFGVVSKHLWEAKTNALIMCFFCNVSELPPTYRHKLTWVFQCPFSPPHGRKDKHQEGNNKKNAKLLEGLDANIVTYLRFYNKLIKELLSFFTTRSC